MNDIPMVPALTLVHRAAHRARFRLTEPPSDVAALADALASLPGVDRAMVRPHTGSVILETAGPMEKILAALESADFVSMARPAPRPPVGQVLTLGAFGADAGVRSSTGGLLDLRSSMALLLLFGAIVQLMRGRFVGPAATLIMGALSLIDLPKK